MSAGASLRARWAVWAAAAAACLAAGAASGTMLVARDLADLTQNATAIVLGRVLAVHGEWDHARSRIHSVASVGVERVLKGPVEPTVTVRALGGEIPGAQVGYRVPGSPRFEPGEAVVLFLRPEPSAVDGGGLDHSPIPTASMAPTLDVSAGELRRALTADDVAGAAFLYPVPGVPPVVVTLLLNQAAYRPGDTLVLTAGAANGATSPSLVDVYVSVRLPGGQVLSLAGGSFSAQAVPLATNLALPVGSRVGPAELFRITLPTSVPPGGYAWEAQLVQPGTRTPWAQASAPFSVTSP